MASLSVPSVSAQPHTNGEIISQDVLQHLKSKVKSEILVKGEASDEAYQSAIHRWNEAYIKEALIIVYCESDEDIASCLQFVQEYKIDLAVAGGRHSYNGASSGTSLVIDLRKMRKVSLDKAGMTITAQGGCLAMDLEKPADEAGLGVVFGAANDTGIAGITMGGGSGPWTGQYGTVSDNLLAAKIVLADGRILQTSETENSELFWAIRGCGPNFGVVTEFTYKLHEQKDPVFHGMFAFTPDKLDSYLALFDKMYETVDKCAGKLLFMAAFAILPGSEVISPLGLIFYDGPEEEARSLAAPLFDLGPMMAEVSMKRYPEVTVPTPVMTGPPTHQRYASKNMQLAPPIDIESFKDMVQDFGSFVAKYGTVVGPSKMALEMRYTGVTSSVPVNTMAYAARPKACLVVVEAQYSDPSLDETMRSEVKIIIEALQERLHKRAGKPQDEMLVLNANIGDGKEKVHTVFGDNLPRLKELKKKYDPGFIFNKWYPISVD